MCTNQVEWSAGRIKVSKFTPTIFRCPVFRIYSCDDNLEADSQLQESINRLTLRHAGSPSESSPQLDVKPSSALWLTLPTIALQDCLDSLESRVSLAPRGPRAEGFSSKPFVPSSFPLHQFPDLPLVKSQLCLWDDWSSRTRSYSRAGSPCRRVEAKVRRGRRREDCLSRGATLVRSKPNLT